MPDKMETIVSLCKRRGFVFPSSEIYGGLANAWDYGPLGVELKNNIKQAWWQRFVHQRDDVVGLDAALLMNPKVWEASGHLANFTDPLVDCKKCKQRFRADHLLPPTQAKPDLGKMKTPPPEKPVCPNCGGELTEVRKFNLMLKTFLGPVEDATAVVYFRPETAQAMFVDFKQIQGSTRKRIPFGIAQVGKAFRNEVTPGNFIFRTREFEQMEIEYFIKEGEWEKWFEHWLGEMKGWLKFLGIPERDIVYREIPAEERAHYSKRTIDIDYQFPFGQMELYGLAYRTNYDLTRHAEVSGQDLRYMDPETNEKYFPHVIEPTWGVDRSVLAVLCAAYTEVGEAKQTPTSASPSRNASDEHGKASAGRHVVLKLPRQLAPFKAAVFPLLANKPDLVKLARSIYDDLRKQMPVAWDDRGNIGKRYFSQDEIGTPACITVDFDSLNDNAVTVRDRDTMKQERVKIGDLSKYLTPFP